MLLILLVVALFLLLPLLLRSPAASMVLLGLLFAGLATPTLLVKPEVGSSSARFKLCWLWVEASTAVHYDDVKKVYVVNLSLIMQPPDPCHRLLWVRAAAGDSVVYVTLKGESPEPGTMCIQVLPKPAVFKTTLKLPEKPRRLVLVFTDMRTGEVCRETVFLTG